MKFFHWVAAVSLVSSAWAGETPKVFGGLLEAGVPVRGQVGMVLPPPEIDKYIAKVEGAARKDSAWFKEFSKNSKPGVPLPYDERLGLTRAEYDEYLTLWEKREFRGVEDVMLLLRESSGGTWTISATGSASNLSTLRYSEKVDTFRSPNGELKRLDDIKADSQSLLGAWSGHEWKFEEETGLGKIKENLAIGRFDDEKFGVIVYRAQEISSEGTRLLDKSLVIRFGLAKGSKPTEKQESGAAKLTDNPKKPKKK